MRHLDTDTVIAYLSGHRGVDQHITVHIPRIAISSIVLAELTFGAIHSSKPVDNLARVREFLQLVETADFDSSCAEIFGNIKSTLLRKGKTIGDVDIQIAATAIANNAILATHNTRHFKHIDGLNLEDWVN